MSIPPRENNDDDAARLALAEAELARRTVAALRAVRMPAGHADVRVLRSLARCDLDRITAEQRLLLRLMAWRWRRNIPAGLAPRMNPADPIVRAMEAQDGR